MIVKRSISIRGHPTSITIEDDFWTELRAIAASTARPLAALIADIDAERSPEQNLSSAIRVFVLRRVLDRAAALQPPPGDKDGNGSTPGSP